MLKKSFKFFAILTSLFIFSSFKPTEQNNLKDIKPFVGIWNNVNNAGSQIVIKSDGSFYNINKENELRTITQSGHIQILSDKIFAQDISYALVNSTYDLKGRQYAIQYSFGKDKQTLRLSGFVDGRNGVKGISWVDELVKTDHIN